MFKIGIQIRRRRWRVRGKNIEIFSSVFDFNKIEEYFEIYKWVYNGGNLNDKIGLARNIISLHFLKKGELG